MARWLPISRTGSNPCTRLRRPSYHQQQQPSVTTPGCSPLFLRDRSSILINWANLAGVCISKVILTPQTTSLGAIFRRQGCYGYHTTHLLTLSNRDHTFQVISGATSWNSLHVRLWAYLGVVCEFNPQIISVNPKGLGPWNVTTPQLLGWGRGLAGRVVDGS